MNMRKFAIAIGLTAAVGAAALACSGDDDDTVTTNNNPDAGSGDASSPYTHAAIKAFVADVVTDQFANDAIVISYFGPNGANASMAVTAPSKATVNDIEECLTFQLGALLGDGDTYNASSPPVVAGDGYVCRTDMATIHAPLFITGPVFDKFIADFVAEATLKGIQLPTTALTELAGLRSTISTSSTCIQADAAVPYATAQADCADSGVAPGDDDAGGDDDAATPVDAASPVDSGSDAGIADAAADG